MRMPAAPRRQRGIGLIEALIAFLVLTVGMLAIARVQAEMRLNAEVARQRSEAVRLAQEDIESLRAFGVLAAASGARSYEAIASEARSVAAGNASYHVARQIDGDAALPAKRARVTVGWADRRGGDQQVVLATVIAGTAPAYSGALGLARPAAPTRGPFGRSVRIPVTAKDLGDGRSAFKPVGTGSVAFLFDNASGSLVGRCAGLAATTPTRDLTPADLGACDSHAGLMLGGVVRFSSASPPDPAQANELPLSMSIAMTGGTGAVAPACSVEAIGGTGGDRFVAWHCAVYPSAGAAWSGRVTVVPDGWTIGTGSVDRRVCRYAAGGGLLHQNLLVIKGSETCPAGRAVRIAGNNGDVYVDLSTSPHQP